MFRNIDPEANVEDVGYPIINGKKSFFYILIFTPPDDDFKLKQLTYTFYEKGNMFIITMTTGIDLFSKHRRDFKKIAGSMVF